MEHSVDDILARGVGELYDPEDRLRTLLAEKASGAFKGEVVIKFGVDPTRPDIHLGHAVILRKLRQLQDIGCKVVFLIGDFTAQIGDPSGRSKVRPEIAQAEVEHNMQTYLEQVGKILNTDPAVFSWIRNSDWFVGVVDIDPGPDAKVTIGNAEVNPRSFLGKAALFEETRMQKTHLHAKEIVSVTFARIMWTLRHITYGRLIQRDMFQERIAAGEELYMHEMMYPILQGIDSDVIAKIYGACDIEIGGTDQTFNMLIARDIMRANKQTPQAVLSICLLEGVDGSEKMSKSLDNYIGITDAPADMYGKVMRVPDSSLKNYFELCTYTPLTEVARLMGEMESGTEHPRDVKMRLAREIVTIYHGEKAAQNAEEQFVQTFQEGAAPSDIQKATVTKGTALIDVLLQEALVSSKSDFQRLFKEGAIKVQRAGEWEPIDDAFMVATEPITLKIGKRRFLALEIA